MTGYSFSKIFNHKSGWYCGDFHAHTNASDDGDYSPTIVAGIARTEGLDFITITDHNTTKGLSELDENLDFLIIPGIEVTLDRGHFNVFGTVEWCQWMEGVCVSQNAIPLPDEYQMVSELMHQISKEGHLTSINHPWLHPWEWLYNNTDLRYVHCVELWNDLFWPDNVHANPKTVELWADWLNAGYRVTAIGGSDYHYPPKPELGLPGERLGYPTTYVYAVQLSVDAILEGLRRRRAYVSCGPRVTFQAEIGGTTYMIGDDLGEQEGEIEFTITILDKPEKISAQIIKNGKVLAKEQLHGRETSAQFHDQVIPAHSDWYRLDVSDMDGHALVITNPIFVNSRQRTAPYFWDGPSI